MTSPADQIPAAKIGHAPSSLTRKIAAAGMVAAGFLFLTLIATISFTNEFAAQRDFIQYWAAGHQAIHHANTYDIQALFHWEKTAGMHDNVPRISVSPPVALEFLAPFGWLSPKSGMVLWSMLELACLGASSWLLWKVMGRPDSRLHLLVFAFAPTISCEIYGQLGIFMLMGLALFLYLHRTHPVAAGAALLPFALKPHLVLPLALVLLAWSLRERKFRILAGFAATLAASCAFSLHFDSNAWAHYSHMMAADHDISAGFVPTLSVALRFALHRGERWIEFIPEACACTWALWYYWTRRNGWSWIEEGLLVLLVGIMCAPYAWFMDESIVFPAILFGMYRAVSARRTLLPILILGAAALIEVLTQLATNRWYFLWTTPAWLGWYLYATRDTHEASLRTAD